MGQSSQLNQATVVLNVISPNDDGILIVHCLEADGTQSCLGVLLNCLDIHDGTGYQTAISGVSNVGTASDVEVSLKVGTTFVLESSTLW